VLLCEKMGIDTGVDLDALISRFGGATGRLPVAGPADRIRRQSAAARYQASAAAHGEHNDDVLSEAGFSGRDRVCQLQHDWLVNGSLFS